MEKSLESTKTTTGIHQGTAWGTRSPQPGDPISMLEQAWHPGWFPANLAKIENVYQNASKIPLHSSSFHIFLKYCGLFFGRGQVVTVPQNKMDCISCIIQSDMSLRITRRPTSLCVWSCSIYSQNCNKSIHHPRLQQSQQFYVPSQRKRLGPSEASFMAYLSVIRRTIHGWCRAKRWCNFDLTI